MRGRGDQGQTTAEYLGMVVVVALLVTALATSGLPKAVADGLGTTICRFVGKCESQPVRRAAPTKADDGGGFLGRLGDGFSAVGRGLTSFGKGVYEGVRDPLALAWKLNPQTNPRGFLKEWHGLGAGLWHGVQNPKELAKAAVDWETWSEDPARALGHLVPDLVLAVTTGGAGTAATRGASATTRGAKALDRADDLADAGKSSRVLDDGPSGGAAASRAGNRLGTADGEAVFWSGLPRPGYEAAEAWSRKQGGTTLEMALEQRGIELPPWNKHDPNSIAAWEKASRDFAEGAGGRVRVLQEDTVAPGSVFGRVEYPALKRNPRVREIVAIDPRTGRETVLWRR